MTATISHLADFDSRELTYAVVQPDGTLSFIKTTDATALLAALIPGYASLTAAQLSGNRSATRKARRALLDARRAHAQALRVTLQRRINTEAGAGTWMTLSAEERAELTRAATGGVPLGILVEEETWMAGIPYLIAVGRWDAHVPLVVSSADYALLASGDVWNDEPVGDNLLVLDPTDDDLYVASLEAIGVLTLADGNAVA